jgi:putative ABC transport system permease protein
LKQKDVDAMKRKENVPDLIDIAPMVLMSETVNYGSEAIHPTVYGWSSDFLSRVLKTNVSSGVGFDSTDIKQEASVAVIGSKVVEDLFGNEDPIGKSIRIKGHNFRVVGVFEKKGGSSLFNIDNVVLIPYTTALTYISGKNYFQEIMIQVKDSSSVERTVHDVTMTLRELHNITDPDKDDFYLETSEAAIKQISTILSTLTIFLTAVVAISLVVGGIGVMNVMLVSVTERTREIGLRKALGARNRDILFQFLFEAIFLTLMGGLIDIILGAVFGYIAANILSQALSVVWTYAFPLKATLIGLFVSLCVGLVFGIYPAWKASKKSPIEALRYE